MEGEKSVSTLAQCKVCECSSHKNHSQEATQSLEEGEAQPRHTAKPVSLSVCLPAVPSACLSYCCSVSSSGLIGGGGAFPTKGRGSVNLPTRVPTSSSIPDSICTDLRRAALIIESRRERWYGGVWGSTLSLYEPRALENKSRLQWDNNRLFLRYYTDAFMFR